MIVIGISHLLYTCNSRTKDIVLRKFLKKGFKLDFFEKDIPNPPQKMKFLKIKDNTTHNIYFLRKNSCIPIEVVEYKRTIENPKNIIPSFKEKLEVTDILQGNTYINSQSKIYYRMTDTQIIFVKNSINLLKKIGLKQISPTNYKFVSPLKSLNFEVSIEDTTALEKTYMDCEGWIGFSLFCKNLNKGFHMKINGKNLKIVLLQENSFILELMEVVK